jgi:hypothetical protein
MLRSLAENITIKGEAEVMIELLRCKHTCAYINHYVLAGFESTNEVKYQTFVHAME